MTARSADTLLAIQDLQLAFGGTPDNVRAFSTLVVKGGAQARGGLGAIFRAMTMDGRVVAVKKMLPPDRMQFSTKEAWLKEFSNREAAFREEYAALCRLSAFKGFVKVYGYGKANGVPAIIMEWVVGVPLSKLIKLPAFVQQQGAARTLLVACIGRDLFKLLARLESQTELFVHRDISPANVMIRLANRPIDQQIAEGAFDLCLIDFGSSSATQDGDGSFTTSTRILRGATPDFAAPEMLTNDIPGLAELRKSTKIDVYAACSTIYWLLCGKAPFDMSSRSGAAAGSDYLYKMTNDPRSGGFPPGSVEFLLEEILLLGIRPTQDARASAYALYKSLDFYVTNYNDNLKRAASGNSLGRLDVRTLDTPVFSEEQIDMSNPLAGQALEWGMERSRSTVTYAKGERTSVPPASITPSHRGVLPDNPPSNPPSISSKAANSNSVVVVIVVAAVIIACALGFVLVRTVASGSMLPGGIVDGSDEPALSSEGAAAADSAGDLARAWTGVLTETSKGPACYGAESDPCTIVIRDGNDPGEVVVSGSVLFHGHDRDVISSDVDQTSGDSHVQLGDLHGAMSGNSIEVIDSDENKLGAGSSIRIVIEWAGTTDAPQQVTAKVYSTFNDSETCDIYSLDH